MEILDESSLLIVCSTHFLEFSLDHEYKNALVFQSSAIIVHYSISSTIHVKMFR